MVEQKPFKLLVLGSSPSRPTSLVNSLREAILENRGLNISMLRQQ